MTRSQRTAFVLIVVLLASFAVDKHVSPEARAGTR
jgi:hypothetical protein